jgi:hypothetical protein
MKILLWSIGNFSNTNNNKMSSNYDPLKELQDLFISKHGDTSNASSINGTSQTAMSNVFDMISNNYGESSLPPSSSSANLNSLMMPMSTTSSLMPKSLMDESRVSWINRKRFFISKLFLDSRKSG